MKSWARIHRDAGESQRLTKLLCEHPVSDALFWRLKAWADDYGRCTADPYKLASRLAPRCVIEGGLNVDDFAQAIRDWEACRVVDDEGATRMIRCERLGIEEEFVGSYTAAWEHGRKLVERHLREHGPVKLERAPMTEDERAAMIAEVFGGR